MKLTRSARFGSLAESDTSADSELGNLDGSA